MSKITLVGIVFITACVSNSTTPGGGGGGGGGGSGGGSLVEPKLGTWDYSQVRLITTTCSQNVNNGEAGNFAIDAATTASFHVLPNDGNPDFTCSLSSGNFACPDRIAQVYDYRPSFDAVVTIHVSAQGMFSSSTAGTGSQDATVDCSGTACDAYGPFPCDFTQDFSIVAL